MDVRSGPLLRSRSRRIVFTLHNALARAGSRRRKWRGLVDAKTSAADSVAAPAAESRADGERRPNPGPARLNVSALRRAVAVRMWGGKGSGLPCDFCRVIVAPEDVEYEVEAQLDGATVMLRFHYRCHYAWTGGEDPRAAGDDPRVAADRA